MSQLPAREVYKFIDDFEKKTEFLEFARAELGLKNYEINGVLDDYNDSREQKYQILSLWKRKRGRQATMQRLYELRQTLNEQEELSFDESYNESNLTSSLAGRPHTIEVRAQVSLQNAVEHEAEAGDEHSVKSASGVALRSSRPGHAIPENPGIDRPSDSLDEIPELISQIDGKGPTQSTGHVSDQRDTGDMPTYPRNSASGIVIFPTNPGDGFSPNSPHQMPDPIYQVSGKIHTSPIGSHRQEDEDLRHTEPYSGNASLFSGHSHTIPEKPGIDFPSHSVHKIPDRQYQNQRLDKLSDPHDEEFQKSLLKFPQRDSPKISPIGDEELTMKEKAWGTKEEDSWYNPEKQDILKPPEYNECARGTGSISDDINNTLPDSMASSNIRQSCMCDEVKKLHIINCSKDDIQVILQKDNIYAIQNIPKGYVVIFNYNFKGEKGCRIGAGFDVKNMKDLWEGFGCSVVVKEDLPADEVWKIINKITESKKMLKYDFFVMFIMSHGNTKDSFITADKKFINVEDVLGKFDNKNAKHLIKKPKLFFFQMCRGKDIDHGFSITKTTATNTTEYQPDLEIAHSDSGELHTVRSDMLISYPTQSGFRSYRGDKGSWFMNAIANVFSKYARNEHVSEMMLRVRRSVMEKTGSTPTCGTANVHCKEMSESRDLLSKKLYLMPGYPEDDLLL